MKFGIDCAVSVTDTAALQKDSVEFVCRYLSPPGNAKNLTIAEAGRIQKAALGLVVVWEENGDEPFSGTNAGVRDARLAVAEAHELGMPDTAPIYFALDRDPSNLSASQTSAVKGYYKGVASVLGGVHRVGAYGGYALVKMLFDAKLITYGWQTYAWSGGVWDARAQLRQYLNAQQAGGLSVDFDHATQDDYGQWHPPVPRPVYKKPSAATVSYLNADGHRVSSQFRGLGWFQLRHPKAWWRGELVSRPVHKK